MPNLHIGVCQVSVMFHHSQSLKDKRKSIHRIENKLKGQGFSVTECGLEDNPKRGVLGFVYAGQEHQKIERAISDALKLFVAELEVVNTEKDIFDYSELKAEGFPIEGYEDL